MATPLSNVIEVIETLKSVEVTYANADVPIKHAKLGVTQASIALDVDWNVSDTEISADLTTKQVYLCGLYAFRNFAFQDHHGLTQKAVNFKTINFAVTGLTERAKEAMRIVWWLDTEIAKTLATFGTIAIGSASEMGGSTDDTTA
ncbi:hypothetical protein [Paenibacillus sp. MMO-177]|uniref:hypothetical protein n=1 Tax=Paenibacillus sp. MMO-177 TaxID=3081289 RepID=UPI00301B4FC5